MRKARPHLAGDAKNEQIAGERSQRVHVFMAGRGEDLFELVDVADHRLYPILRRKSRRCWASSAVSMPFGGNPSITPSTPRPCAVCAMTTSTGLAVAQKIEQTSGTSLIRLRMLIG